MKALTWPRGLNDDTPLPYSVWRVMDLLDGRRGTEEIANLARVSVQDIHTRFEEAQRWVNRAAQREQRVTPEAAREVTQCLTSVVGPMASLLVDELLEELGKQATMSSLISGLAEQLSPDHLQQFARQLRDRGMA